MSNLVYIAFQEIPQSMPIGWTVEDFHPIQRHGVNYQYIESFDKYAEDELIAGEILLTFSSLDGLLEWAGEPDIKEIEL